MYPECMLLVRVALILVAVAMGVATLLGGVAEKLPGGGLTVPPACVHHAGTPNVQAGYCP